MLPNILDRISFWSLFATIVLLPVFFLPFVTVPAETSKGLLLIVGLVVSLIFWTAARFSDGKLSIPRSPIIIAGLGVVLAFLLSALFSPAMKVSLFGTMLDTGTFFFMLSAFLLLFLSSIILRDIKNARMVFWGVIASSLALLIFQVLRMFIPEMLSLGILGAKTDTLLGSWNAFGIFAGFSTVLSLFVIEFFSLPKVAKGILGFLVVLSLFVSAAVNLLLVWVLLGVFALLVFIYKLSFSYSLRNKEGEEGKKGHFPLFSFGLVLVSLLFFMSGQFIGGYLPETLGLSTMEVGPSFGATLEVAKQALADSPLFGTGPNRFGEAWNMYKSGSINSTIFWDTSFGAGSGLIPTLAVTTGALGILALLVFFYLFISAGVKSLFASIQSSAGKEMAVFFVLAFYLFVSAFFYVTGPVIFLLAFAFTGAFAGLASTYRQNGDFEFSFLDDPRKSFFSILGLVLLMLVSAAAGFKYVERFASIPFFQKTLSATEISAAETSMLRAVSLHSNDLYLRTYSQVYMTKIGELAAKGSALTEEEQAVLQASIEEAIGSAQLATAYDKTNYLNFASLGSVYNTVGALGVEGAYGQAFDAYTTAATLNPLNPGIKLAMARVSFANNRVDDARILGEEALALKPNYVDALLVLSQIEQNSGNNAKAVSYAETALSLVPGNQELTDYVNSLKRGAPAATVPVVPTQPDAETIEE
ncbi:MAG TPA: hypothetical protein VFQ59_03010 [Candidatus Paceibacterota bacterium]|nr:hypothetical protein [Candidatus Paceibacterota bacterium]